MLNLLINHYADPDPARNAELQACLNWNINQFTRVLYWPDDPGFAIKSVNAIKLGGPPRPTIAQLFQAMNGSVGPADITVLANSDIRFDRTLNIAEECLDAGDCFALTRWEPHPTRGLQIFSDDDGNPRCDSQDAWIFRGPVRNDLLPGGKFAPNFTLGVRGCDNALAYRIRQAGYRLSNPSLQIRCTHEHATEVRRYSHEQGSAVPAPYALIYPHLLGRTPPIDIRL